MRNTLRGAAILAAGTGERLRPLTSVTPKILLPIDRRPILYGILDQLIADGISFVAVNGYHLADQVHYALRAYPWPKDVHWMFSHEQVLMGTAGGLRLMAAEFSSNPILVINGDSNILPDWREMQEFHRSKRSLCTVAVIEHPNYQRFGALQLGGAGRVTKVSPPKMGSSPDTHFIGTSLVERELLEKLPQDKVLQTGNTLWAAALEQSRFFAFLTDVPWVELGDLDSYFQYLISRSDPLVYNRIDNHVRFRNCVLWPDVTWQSPIELENCLVTEGVHLPAHTELRDLIIVPTSRLRRREPLLKPLSRFFPKHGFIKNTNLDRLLAAKLSWVP